MLVYRKNNCFKGLFSPVIASLYFPILCIFFSCGEITGIHPENCQWLVNIVNSDNTSEIQTIISPEGSYILRTQVMCSSQINPEVSRYLTLLGVVPEVHVDRKVVIPDANGHHISQYTDVIKLAIIDIGQQEIKSSTDSCNHELNSNDQDAKLNCSDYTELCNPAWVAPLVLRKGVISLGCRVDSHGIGPMINSFSHVFNVDGFHDINQRNTIGEKLSASPKVIEPTPLNCVTQKAPVCIFSSILMSDSIIYTNTEFLTMEIIQVQDIFNGTNLCQENYPSSKVIKGSLSLLDTIIFNTPVGLVEVKGSLMATLQTSHEKHVVFEELHDSNHTEVCQYISNQLNIDQKLCMIVTGSVCSDGTVLVLVKVNYQYHIVHLKEDYNNMVIIEESLSYNATQQPILVGMSYTAVVGNDIFLWGNMLLYSPKSGRSLQRLTAFPYGSNITIFTSTFDGTYALLTDNYEIWAGVVGTDTLLQLEAAPTEWHRFHGTLSLATMFFDLEGKLQQVILNSQEKCLYRQQIYLQDILISQNYHQSRLSYMRERNISSSDVDSCSLDLPGNTTAFAINHVQRSCPYARMKIVALHSIFYTRKVHKASKPPVIANATLAHDLDHLSQFSIDSETVQDTHDDRLPSEISLHRLESYAFEVYLYLDDERIEEQTERHSWTLDHLRLSFHVSDPSLINVSSKREELLEIDAVKYEVSLQDKGVHFTQHPPGKGLVPVSLTLHSWMSAFSCWEESSEETNFKSPQIMIINLGCPGNRQVVFNAESSMNDRGQKHYCDSVKGIPCFLYERVFYPLFDIVDMSTGNKTAFLGQYTLTIVGGGLDQNTISDYTEQEQQSFNFKTAGWLCGTESPCANIEPKFMDNAQFYFKVEFSNRGVANTNCDYTLQFVIRVHALPPGSLHPSSIIVLSCLGIIISIIMTLFIFKRQDQRLLKQLKQKIRRVLIKEPVLPVQDGIEMANMQKDFEGSSGPIKNRSIAWEKKDKKARSTSLET